MSNTVIQIKRSTVTAVPPSLNVAELAYSFVSETLFIGNTTNDAVAIGGAALGAAANAYADFVGVSANSWASEAFVMLSPVAPQTISNDINIDISIPY